MSEAHTPVLTLDEIKGGPIAEQLNAWLNGFEAQLRQMSATHYDFCVDVLMLLYKEMAEGRMLEKERELSEEFWDAKQAKIPADDGGNLVELRWRPQDDGGILLKSSLNLPDSGGNRPRFQRTTVEIWLSPAAVLGMTAELFGKATDPAEAARHRTKIHRFPPGG
ncbi:hypothetical protein B0H13DRAFT_1888995 [Mycena leptocephala]|nr:hypothetical protein B0H13DRAFT_1888995 [Mycena leptocephala]